MQSNGETSASIVRSEQFATFIDLAILFASSTIQLSAAVEVVIQSFNRRRPATLRMARTSKPAHQMIAAAQRSRAGVTKRAVSVSSISTSDGAAVTLEVVSLIGAGENAIPSGLATSERWPRLG
ncbi:hypothetical protein GCM10023156_02850 [Novipirellula rosea]|uniref:Uncharacterized protein n=1 Tax=Novipirellula rosea TaxID=1031540 RepID=A0ABP8M7Q3_9BACT